MRRQPLCAATRQASTPSTTAEHGANARLSSISQQWYADYHSVVQRLERLYWERVGQRDVDDATLAVQLNEPSTSSATTGGGGGGGGGKDDDFYVNAGVAIRTLREDIPLLFQQDLDCTLVSLVLWTHCAHDHRIR